MLVSVIIPIYNVEDYIERCINAVLHQTYRPIEVILVDDCTPDRSMEFAKRCINADLNDNVKCADMTFIYLKHDCNRGLSAARNTGMDVATGKYVYFLDSDDEIKSDCIERLVQPLKNYFYDFVVGGYADTNGKRNSPSKDREERGNKEVMKSFANREWYVFAWNKLYNRKFLKTHHLRFKEGIYHEDVLWSFHLACVASSVFLVSSTTYSYRIRQDSISRANNSDKRAIDLLTVFEKMYLLQLYQKRYDYTIDSAIRQFFPLLEETMRQLPSFSLWDFYKKIRTADSRTMSQKRCVYNTVTRKLRYLDYFLPTSIGFIYRYFCWRMVRIKAGHAQIPFIY